MCGRTAPLSGPIVLLAALTPAGPSAAQSGAASGDAAAELAKKLANPVASLISVPFQYNYNEGFGPQDGHQS
jgi:hypothetical protein